MRDAVARAGIAPARASTPALTTFAAIEGALINARANRDATPLETIAIELQTVSETALAAQLPAPKARPKADPTCL